MLIMAGDTGFEPATFGFDSKYMFCHHKQLKLCHPTSSFATSFNVFCVAICVAKIAEGGSNVYPAIRHTL
jgi:hypothetical protein